MALDFSKQPSPPPQTSTMESTALVPAYDIQAEREQMTKALVNSPEVDAIVSTIEVFNMESVVNFGGEVAEEISRASDVVLNSMSMSQLDQSSTMLVTLSKIMDKFDIDEIKDDPSFFGKIFGNMRKKLDAILEKYNTMGAEVDKIYIELKGYENEITQANRKLNDLFEANVNYYHELVKYILAGEQAQSELSAHIEQRTQEMNSSGDASIQFEVQSLQQCLMLLEQRTHDLRIAENVALQSIPMIKTMEFTNMNLVRKINSAFIITLPVFKQALAQAIMLKRQKIQADAMAALDEKTNELLIKNAQNTVNQSKMVAQMSSGSAVQMDTLETTWRTIVNGIEETKEIQLQAHQRRQEEQVRLERIKAEFQEKYHVPPGKS